MAQDIARLGIEVDSSGVIKATKNLNKLDKQSSKTEKKNDRLKKSFTGLGAAIGALGLAAAFVKITKLAIEQEKAVSQVEAAIKSTGGTAGFTSKELQRMAASFQNVSNYGDEAILSMQSVLLTFTKIQGDILPKTTEAVLDLSARMGIDLQSAAVQLGKALNDPVANLSALSRSGIQFSDSQKSTIKALVETNRLADAQTIILKELNTQFGGSAKAARDTFGGAIVSLGNAFGDLLEGDGGNLNDAKGAIEQLTKILQDDGTKAAFSAITTLIIGITSALAGMVGGLSKGGKAFGEFIANSLSKESTSERLDDISERMKKLGFVMKETMKFDKDTPMGQEFEKARKELILLGQEWNNLGGNILKRGGKEKSLTKSTEGLKGGGEGAITFSSEKDLDLLRDKYTSEYELLQEKYANERTLLEEKLLSDKSFQDEFDALTKSSKEQQAIDEIALTDKTEKAKLAIKEKTTKMQLNIANNLAVLMTSKNKEMFEIGKIAATAGAIINTYEGATKALAQGGFYGVAMAAAVIAAGTVQVSNIQSQQFGGGGGLSSSGAIGGGGVQSGLSGGGSIPSPIPFNEESKRQVNITLNGAGYSRENVRDLIEQINEELGDGLIFTT